MQGVAAGEPQHFSTEVPKEVTRPEGGGACVSFTVKL